MVLERSRGIYIDKSEKDWNGFLLYVDAINSFVVKCYLNWNRNIRIVLENFGDKRCWQHFATSQVSTKVIAGYEIHQVVC